MPRILTPRELVISHGILLTGLVLISLWLWFQRIERVEMLICGLFLTFGGLCFIARYSLRKLIR